MSYKDRGRWLLLEDEWLPDYELAERSGKWEWVATGSVSYPVLGRFRTATGARFSWARFGYSLFRFLSPRPGKPYLLLHDQKTDKMWRLSTQ